MIKKLLREISIDMYKSEDRTSNYFKYAKMRNHDGWAVHQMFMVAIANKLSECLLSAEFTKLNIEEKDANQRAFYMTKEIINFLMDPLKGANKYAKVALHNKKMMEATQRQPNRKS